MKGNSDPEEKLSRRPSPLTTESLSEPAIKRQLLSDAVQHPATLLPLATFVMSVLYLVLVSPILGGAPWAMVLLAVSGILAAAGFVWRYVIRYTEEYGKRARELMGLLDEERAQLEQAEMRQLRDALQGESSSIGSNEGLKALTELVGEYEELQPTLGRQRDTDTLSVIPCSLPGRRDLSPGTQCSIGCPGADEGDPHPRQR